MKQSANCVVAPPRGERGLKCSARDFFVGYKRVAPPRGERGLKFAKVITWVAAFFVAPPRGERGLKCRCLRLSSTFAASLPLVGSVD